MTVGAACAASAPAQAPRECRSGTIAVGPACVGLGSAAAATRLSSFADCSDTARPRARLSWRPAARADEQRVAVTIYRDGFERPRYQRSRALPAGKASLVWRRIQGQAIHRWVVLTRRGDRWTASRPAKFEGPGCVADMQP